MANNDNMGGTQSGSKVFQRQGGNMTDEERRRLQMEGDQDSFQEGDGEMGSQGLGSDGSGTSGGGRDGSRSEGDQPGGMGGSGMGGY